MGTLDTPLVGLDILPTLVSLCRELQGMTPPHFLKSSSDIGHEDCKQQEAFLFTGENGGRCLVLHQRSPRSWYKSRENCVEREGRLAVFNNETLYRKFKQHLREELQVSGDYWVGMRDSALEWQNGKCFNPAAKYTHT